MKKLRNALCTFGFNILAVMPFWLIYALTFLSYYPVYYLVRYRRKVVRRNIDAAFPEKTSKHRREIGKVFYLYFIEYILEICKMRRLSAKQLSKHISFENVDLVRNYLKEGRPVVGFYSHCGNWEWVTLLADSFSDMPDAVAGAVYRPLKDKWLDKQMYAMRTHYNNHCYPKATVFRDLRHLIDEGKKPFCVFMSDQKPSHGDKGYILEFLNQPTAMITGTEAVARKLGAAAVFLDMTKLSRGHYHVRILPMADNVADTQKGYVTALYAKLLEENIRRQPPIWLWSHNRWKNPVTLPAEEKTEDSIKEKTED